MKNVKTLLIFITISAFVFASETRVNALGGAGFWADDVANIGAFPAAVNNHSTAWTNGDNFTSIWNVDGFYRPLLTSSLLGVIVRCRFSFFWSCEIFCRLWLNSSHFSFCKSTVLVTKKNFLQNWPKISLNRFFFLNSSSELDSE